MEVRKAGVVLVTVGIVLFLFNYGVRLDFLAYPLVFPSLMILFGTIELIMGLLENREYKGFLDLIVFVWLVLTFFAYGAQVFRITSFVPLTQAYSQDLDLSMAQDGSLSVDIGKIDLQRGTGSLSARHAGGFQGVLEQPNTFTIDVNAAELTVSSNRSYTPNSTLMIDVGAGEINAQSTLGFSNVTAHAGLGSVEIALDADGPIRLNAEVGLGSIEIIISSLVEYSITYSVGLGSYSGAAPCSFSCSGTYETSGYDTAADRAEITASVGMGSITVQRI